MGQELLESGDQYAIQDYMKSMSMIMNAYGQAGGGDAGREVIKAMGEMSDFKDIVGSKKTVSALTKAVDNYGIDLGGVKEEAKLAFMNGTFDASKYMPMGWAISAGERSYEQVNNDRILTQKAKDEREVDRNTGNAFTPGFRSRAAEKEFGSEYYNDPRMLMYKIGSVSGDAAVVKAWQAGGGTLSTSTPSVENDATILMNTSGMESLSIKNKRVSTSDFYKWLKGKNPKLKLKNSDDLTRGFVDGKEYQLDDSGALESDLWAGGSKPVYTTKDTLHGFTVDGD
jgi:hypothetical protein